MADVFLGLGTNLGDRLLNLSRAVAAVARLGEVTAVSSIYASAPVGFADQPDFWNAALRLRTTLEPLQLLHALKRIEAEIGRVPSFRNGPREIDIDILTYDELVLERAELTIPHPRMDQRAFVLHPLREIGGRGAAAPDDTVSAQRIRRLDAPRLVIPPPAHRLET